MTKDIDAEVELVRGKLLIPIKKSTTTTLCLAPCGGPDLDGPDPFAPPSWARGVTISKFLPGLNLGIRATLHSPADYEITGTTDTDLMRVEKGSVKEGDWIWVWGHAYEVIAEYENLLPPIVLNKPHNIRLDRNCDNN